MSVLIESLSDIHRLLHPISELTSSFLLECRGREGSSWSATRLFFLDISEREVLCMRNMVDDTSLLIFGCFHDREVDPMHREKLQSIRLIFEFLIFSIFFSELYREVYASSRYKCFDLPCLFWYECSDLSFSFDEEFHSDRLDSPC